MRFQSASDGRSTPGIALAATMTAQVEDSYSDLIPDVYVNTQPTDPLDCAMTIELWDGSGDRLLADDGHPCTRGRHYASQVARVLGGCSRPLHTSVWIRVAGRMVRIGDSKPFVFCD
jgi:hypothetical protein